MTAQQSLVRQYFDGFRTGDHGAILGCLADDVVWELPGFKHLEGKAAFDSEIENEEFVGTPTLRIDRMLQDHDVVVAIGEGESTHTSGGRHRFAFCDVFTCTDGGIARVESYVLPLAQSTA